MNITDNPLRQACLFLSTPDSERENIFGGKGNWWMRRQVNYLRSADHPTTHNGNSYSAENGSRHKVSLKFGRLL